MKYLKKFETHTQYEQYVGGGGMIRPNVSYCEDVKDVHYNPIHDYSQDYFTTVALEGGAITFTKTEASNVISYSVDGGNTWTEGNSVDVSNGDKVLWKGTMTPSTYGIGSFSSTCNFNTQGNVMSLLFGDDFKNQLSLKGKGFCFCNLFNGATHLISAENLSLPATTLASNCYMSMFNNCTNLTSAPTILPATTLTYFCYGSMFNGCTSLTTAPELPATALTQYCYASMFQNCASLNYIKAMFTTTPFDNTRNWVNGVAATGTFVKNSAATWDVIGVNGIPEGWTVETA